MSKYTITPWRSPADLLSVRESLYNPSSPTAREAAIARIAAWKSRGNLPHAVDSTALLFDAIAHDDASLDPSSSSSTDAHPSPHHNPSADFRRRAVYSAAFTRFVTGFCDMGRQRERILDYSRASSMLAVARQIGMPEDFVAIRHEVTHDELPSLRRLRGVVTEAVDWLWRVYWSKLPSVGEGSNGEGEEGEGEVKGELGRGLREFRRKRREGLKSGSRDRMDGKEVCGDCVRLCGGRKKRMKVLAQALVLERLLMPSTRRLGQSLDGAFLIWDDLLHELANHLCGFRSMLLQSCLDELTRDLSMARLNDVDREGLVLWIQHLIEGDQSLASTALKHCCLYPGRWTRRLGLALLELGSEDVEQWRDLFEATIGSSALNESGVKTSEKEQMEVDELEGDGMDETREVRGWRRAILPSDTPIGVCG